MFQQNWVVTSITGEFFYKGKKLTLNPCSLRKKQNLSHSDVSLSVFFNYQLFHEEQSFVWSAYIIAQMRCIMTNCSTFQLSTR